MMTVLKSHLRSVGVTDMALYLHVAHAIVGTRVHGVWLIDVTCTEYQPLTKLMRLVPFPDPILIPAKARIIF